MTPFDRPQSSDGSSLEAEDSLLFRFAPPRLYPLALDSIGKSFPSQIGPTPIEVYVPESAPHAIQPVGASSNRQSVPRSHWIVPRSLELTVPAGTDPEDRAFVSSLRGWWTVTTNWLAAWVGEAPGIDMPVPRLVQPLDTEPSESPASGGFMLLYGLGGEAHASSEQFKHALELAGEGGELPPAYALLVRAGSAYTLNDHRVTVMEACSAAELAAASAIESTLTGTGCSAAFIKGAVKRARGIRAAHGVLVELNLECGVENADVKRLAELRNKAAHGASRINGAEAHDARAVARQLVSTLLGPASPTRQ
ncbi:MAG TPA: hypothetical protein VGO31_00375 [Microbacteriaceae bacterium]|jgi:hypothetical protein|nr:hypothetical protein [Microbacteriaceae bacterium]